MSGGEKKRLAIACELIDQPELIFLDEPTSGLDAYQAEQVVHRPALRDLSRAASCTVVCVIHQPSGKVFSLFDDLLLLSEGEVTYFGPADRARAHFGRAGLSCPPHHQPGRARGQRRRRRL